ncbi:MAG: septation protein IspZ [Deltaproteobacteria bacterium]|nr:septation protein IspZ [Deltaproteobacteria bacterium]
MSTPALPSPPDGTPSAPAGPPKWMIEYGPLLVFLALYRLRDIYWATGGFMTALALAMALAYRAEGKLPPTLMFTGALVLPLGVLTIVLRDPRFIYMKPTIVAGVSALVLLGGLARGKGLLRSLLGAQLQLTDEGWRALSLRFALFSLVLAGANEFVWRTYTPDRERTWVLFKFPGIPLLTAVFMATQLSLFKRHAPPSDD